MKYSYIWNTGQIIEIDSDVNLWPDVEPAVRGLIAAGKPAVRALIAAGEGEVPGCEATYKLTTEGRLATLSFFTRQGAPLWSTIFYCDRESAWEAVGLALTMEVPRAPNLPLRLAGAGMLTVLLPSGRRALELGADVASLAEFARTMFDVWVQDLWARDIQAERREEAQR
jgi:hypothetical protein